MAQRKLITQAEYARLRGLNRSSVHKRTATKGGPIPVYGDKKLIDPAEADRLWTATMDYRQVKAGNSRATMPDAPPEPVSAAPADATPGADLLPSTAQAASPVAQAKMAAAIIKAQTDKIQLERLKGTLIDKGKAMRQAFNFARRLRDAWINWPARIGPSLAAELGVDQHLLTAALERHVREHLTDLADQRFDPG